MPSCQVDEPSTGGRKFAGIELPEGFDPKRPYDYFLTDAKTTEDDLKQRFTKKHGYIPESVHMTDGLAAVGPVKERE